MPPPYDVPSEEQFKLAVLDLAKRLNSDVGHNPGILLRMIEDWGGAVGAVQQLIRNRPSDTFVLLLQKNRLDLTVEALALHEQWSTLFEESDLALARKRLREVGYSPYELPSVSVIRDENGVITNAKDLTADEVTHQRVLCPCCEKFVFKMWPEGWDSHAERRCTGISSTDGEARKEKFRTAYKDLFKKELE